MTDGYSISDEQALPAFDAIRPRLFGVAYRMLGSVLDAEDIVQSAWIRWQVTDRSAVQNPEAFLMTVTTRLAINLAQSARAKRETYIGPWIPEPVDTGTDPFLGAERAEGLELAVLMLLEKLSPTERAAYVLREAFDYTYDRIAEVLRLKTPNVRQLVSRARQHINNGRNASADADEHGRLLKAFLAAARDGDVDGLEDLFASEVASIADGGGVVRAARAPLVGRNRVSKLLAGVAEHFWTGVTVKWVQANALPALMLLRGDAVAAFATVSVSEGKIDRILWVMRPSKLEGIARSLERSR